jgi:hypothetical protein
MGKALCALNSPSILSHCECQPLIFGGMVCKAIDITLGWICGIFEDDACYYVKKV